MKGAAGRRWRCLLVTSETSSAPLAAFAIALRAASALAPSRKLNWLAT